PPDGRRAAAMSAQLGNAAELACSRKSYGKQSVNDDWKTPGAVGFLRSTKPIGSTLATEDERPGDCRRTFLMPDQDLAVRLSPKRLRTAPTVTAYQRGDDRHGEYSAKEPGCDRRSAFGHPGGAERSG